LNTILALLFTASLLTACGAVLTPIRQRLLSPQRVTCSPTFDDGLSPSYKPDTPVRSVVGHGHVLTGVVLSSRDCQPIPNAKLEFWPEIEDKGHPEEQRAMLYTDSEGRYRFECDQPEHIHMRISAPGFRTLANNSYHPEGQPEGVFNIVLVPAN
jgi:protocatechuate 3,4-dioxygenase beta subunit